jgi:hypothetical protein
MILEIHDVVKKVFALRMRARDGVVGVENPKVFDAQHAPLLCEVN